MQREETGPEGSSNFPRSPSPGSRPILVSPSVHSKCCPVPSTPPVHRQRPLHPRVGLRAVFPFSLLQSPRGEARDGVPGTRQKQLPRGQSADERPGLCRRVSGPRRRVTWREGGRRRARPSGRARAARSVCRREMQSSEYVWQGGGGGREGRLHPLCACSGPRGL